MKGNKNMKILGRAKEYRDFFSDKFGEGDYDLDEFVTSRAVSMKQEV